jgi:ABC-type uncharacterized transport system substrate-binding protein
VSDIRRREFITLLGGAAVAWPLAARAQQGGKKYTIGLFSAGIRLPENAPAWISFLSAMRELGWIEGKNVVFEGRYADNRLERLPALAEELVRLNVDVIVAIGTLAPLAAKRATSTIPIVMTAAGDPLGSGLVASLAQPGGNVTGMSLMAPDLGGKRLELLKELLPRFARVGGFAQRTGSAMHTPPSAARAAGVTKSAIYRAIKSGRLLACKLNGGSYAIYPAELMRAFPSMAHDGANAARQSSGTFSFPMWDVS